MTLLTRYLIRQNCFLTFAILLSGTCIYLLTDLFERLDGFVDSQTGIGLILLYFLIKSPLIISQILPAVFLIAMAVQLNMLQRSRELTALLTGGIAPSVLIRFIVVYGLVWAGVQFGFAQFLGVAGDQTASRIWKKDVKQDDWDAQGVYKVWFVDKNRVVYVGFAIPELKQGKGVRIYILGKENGETEIREILEASEFTIENKLWRLQDVQVIRPGQAELTTLDELEFPIRQSLEDFLQVREKSKPTQLSIWELGKVIKGLEKSGSDVSTLEVAWHAKLAYAGSLVIMGLAAMAVSQLTANIYKSVGGCLLFVFLFYSLNTVCMTLGEKRVVAPAVGAWLADGLVLSALAAWFLFPIVRFWGGRRQRAASRISRSG